jgi:DNA-binding response OmpR family regulator
MMPDVDGWTVCERIRQVSTVPLIMLTALSQEELIIRGLDYGADDYLTKPCSMELLLARVRALLRRAALPPTTQKSVTYSDNRLTIDLDERRVFILGEPVKLSTTEYRLLIYLFQNAGQVLTFQQILEYVWGDTGQANIDYVHVYVSRLRRKLEVNPKEPVYLVTEYGVGYRFEKQSGLQPKKR